MKIGQLNIEGFAALAPMAGVADRAFRELCSEFGAAFTVSEMVSAKALTFQDKKSRELLFLSDKERPSGAQLFGNEPEIMARAAVRTLEFSPDFIDINMGCPAPKIASNGQGSALMKNPRLTGDIVRAVVDAVSPLPVSVKIRAGWDRTCINAVEIAKICEYNGASVITVHGRTRDQMYSPPVDFQVIHDVKKAVSIPVIANGDITNEKSAKQMIEKTGCDFLMIGRGALGRPWIFRQINEYFNGGDMNIYSTEEQMDIMLGHIKKICEYKGEKAGMLEARKHAAWYVKGIHGAAALRQEIVSLTSIDELEAICEKIIRLSHSDV